MTYHLGYPCSWSWLRLRWNYHSLWLLRRGHHPLLWLHHGLDSLTIQSRVNSWGETPGGLTHQSRQGVTCILLGRFSGNWNCLREINQGTILVVDHKDTSRIPQRVSSSHCSIREALDGKMAHVQMIQKLISNASWNTHDSDFLVKKKKMFPSGQL